MGIFTATANDASTLASAQYGSTRWSTDAGAIQGTYGGTTKNQSNVGTIVFSGAGSELSGQTITSIEFSITCASAGSESSSKQLTFYKANYQTIPSGTQGSNQIGDRLGTLVGKFYNNTTSHTLSSTSNQDFFEALCEYLSAGNSALVLYNGEVAQSSSSHSTNYARITSMTITVTYNDGSETKTGTVWYGNDDSGFTECYVYRCNASGKWELCSPYRCFGGSDWRLV